MLKNILKLAKEYQNFAVKTAQEMLQTVNQNCQVNIPVGKLVGKGQQGEVYELNDKILKIQKVNSEDIANEKISELKRILNLNTDLYPKIFDINKLCPVIQENGEEAFYYYYIMENLYPINGSKEIAIILRQKVSGKPIKQFYDSPFFDTAMYLYEKMENSGTLHIDINDGAIMQDAEGKVKLVDLDSVILTS